MNINNILKNQNLKLNLYTRYGDNEKNGNKGNKNSNTIESGNMVNQCMNNKLNCFNNIMNNEQVYLLNKNTIINSILIIIWIFSYNTFFIVFDTSKHISNFSIFIFFKHYYSK